MAFATWSPPVAPRVAGTSMTLENRTLEATFGDGYEQTAVDGINPTREVWTLSWPGIKDADADTIETFWRTKGKHTPFWYTVPGRSTSKRYKFTSFERPNVTGHLDGLVIGLREVFDVEP